jgi:ankyrin repeat protein
LRTISGLMSSELYSAFRRNRESLEEVRRIVEGNPRQELSETDVGTGAIPLHAAVGEGASRSVLEYLLQCWPDSVYERDHDGNTPLHFAGPESSLASIRLLVNTWPESVEVVNDAGELPLHSATGRRARYPVLRYLLDRNPQALEVPDFAGNLPQHLLFAPDTALKQVQLFEERASANAPARAHLPHAAPDLTLHAAVRRKGPLRVVQYLADRRPGSVHVRDPQGRFPLLHHFAVIDGEVEYGCHKVLLYLLRQWPGSVYETDVHGNTALHHAAMGMATPGAVDLLIEQWPKSVQARNHHGSLALHCLLDQEEPSGEILELLVRSWPGSVREANDQGQLAIHVAVDRAEPSLEAVQILVQHGLGSVGLANQQGQFPIHIAVERGHSLEMVTLLVESWPLSVRAQDAQGRTPVELAAARAAANNGGDSALSSLNVLYYLVARWAELGPLGAS